MKQKPALEAHLKAIQTFRENVQLCKSQEAMWLSALLARTVEIMLHGEPKTPLPTRHHT